MPACAQTGWSATLVSDYRFRGVSLNDGRPALQLSLEYESRNDWYAGAFVSPAKLKGTRANAQLIAYAGYARRLADEVSWEVGAARSTFAGAAEYGYTEAYAGLATDRISARIHAAPDYFGQSGTSLYAELNGAYPIRPWLHLLGHAGILYRSNGNSMRSASRSTRWDARFGLSAALDDWTIQLAAVFAERERKIYWVNGYRYVNDSFRTDDAQAVVLSASYSF